MPYTPKRPLNSYPPLNPGKVTERMQGGEYVKVVEFTFGTVADRDRGGRFYQSTLTDEWATKTATERRDEMFRRYDEYLDVVEAALDPAPPTVADLFEQRLSLVQQRADIEKQIADLNVEIERREFESRSTPDGV